MDCKSKIDILDHLKKSSSYSAVSEKFLSFFLGKIPSEDLKLYSPDNWAELGLRSFQFCEQSSGLKIETIPPHTGKTGTSVFIFQNHRPFLIDSLYAGLVAQKQHISLFSHLVLKLERQGKKIVSLEKGNATITEQGLDSFLYIELEDTLSDDQQQALAESLRTIMGDVELAVRDWQPMRQKLHQVCADYEYNQDLSAVEKKEQVNFLKWLDEGFFIFLGYRFWRATKDELKAVVPEESLGITKKNLHSFFGPDGQTEKNILEQTLLLKSHFNVTKTMVESKVHRPVPMDVIRITAWDRTGQICGEHQFFGLFTAAFYNRPLQDVPWIQEKISKVLEKSQISPDWYDGRRLMYVLESLPRDILFQLTPETISETAHAIMGLKEKHKVSLFVLRDSLGHFLTSLIYVPADRYGASLVQRMGQILADCYKGLVVSSESHLGGDLSFARIHYLISTDSHPQHKIVCDIASTEMLLGDLSLSWGEQLKKRAQESLISCDSGIESLFSRAYQEHFSVLDALKDLPFIQKSLKTGSKTIRLYEMLDNEEKEVHLKIFSPSYPLFLSDIFPSLENMGLRILTEASYPCGEGSETVWIHHFRAYPISSLDPFEKVYDHFIEVLEKVLHRSTEDDSFNRLVVVANLSSQHLLLVRAYYRYMRQLGWPYLRPNIVSAFERYPVVLKKLGSLFMSQFDPEWQAESTDVLLGDIKEALSRIDSTEDENILSSFLTLIRATLRTNFFQKDSEGRPKKYVSLKFSPSLITPLEDTKPLYEVFVYAPWMEGIHLRSGKVARGGLRWSDRRGDYRKEVLELMKAQLVKNAVIVPMGSKGGFYVKTPMDHLSFSQRQEVGIEGYKTFIRGLLDITDNLVNGQVVPPNQVKCRDEDDPYLVVAADKGTATFSDIANALSQEYGFWLGDAFASGGSAGYDHKKMGITSRGAWESIKRHFRELGKSMDSPFTLAGVGDMSGDVFGNGMLLSDQIKLVAAFNHAHIFIDPAPDPAISYQERKRLFQLPRSQWSDYNPDLLSKGGGIYDRKSKSISLSPEAQKILGISTHEIKPDHLIQHILKLTVDLLWFGGIGTYVKSATETDEAVGDRANDLVRINGDQLGAAVVGEGANLAFTQKGRIAYAMKGGKLNRDSVDNSAGVDCSDHEVNIKILFQGIMKAGHLDEQGRNELLKSMTDEVASLVVRHNYLQTQAISMIESRGYKALARQNRLIRFFEAQERLTRDQEALPSEEEIESRIQQKKGLTRPEIAVLVSHTKLYLYEKILESDLPNDPALYGHLKSYFPNALQTRYPSFIDQHPLKKELIATTEANLLVNRLGASFFFELERHAGLALVELIRLFVTIRTTYDLDWYWNRIEELDGKVSYGVQNQLFSLLILFSEQMIIRSLENPDSASTLVTETLSPQSLSMSISESNVEKLTALLENSKDIKTLRYVLIQLKEILCQ
ncbi:MAG: NAD-glutamate dehydrogenase domain-containing protein [Alphaproteobacteria bacterium]